MWAATALDKLGRGLIAPGMLASLTTIRKVAYIRRFVYRLQASPSSFLYNLVKL